MSSPKSGGRPIIDLRIDVPGADAINPLVYNGTYKAMLNGGYIVKFEVSDPNGVMLDKMMKNGYLAKARANAPISMTYTFKWNATASYPEMATQQEIAYVVSLKARGKAPDTSFLEFIGIDPPSWWLNNGDASGAAWKGKISDVIFNVCGKYASNILAIVPDTKDSNQNYWYQFRQDPKSFIGSLIDYATPFTETRTGFIVVPDNDKTIEFKDQGSITSTSRGYYTRTSSNSFDTLIDWTCLSDNALSLTNLAIVTSGLCAISGEYIDLNTDPAKGQSPSVFANDESTSQKKIAETSSTESFAKPSNTGKGWTSMCAIPELYSAGDCGLDYKDYIDGISRKSYLDLVNMLFRAKFTVLGHGEWTGCKGLGTDTIFVDWRQSDRGIEPYFMNGKWLVYGYEHTMTSKYWHTDLYCARFDYDASAQKV